MKPNLRIVETTTPLPPRVHNVRVHTRLLKRHLLQSTQEEIDAPVNLRTVARGVLIGALILAIVAMVFA